MKSGCFLFLLLALPLSGAEVASVPSLPGDHAQRMARGLELFQKQVRPLLVENCLKCHGGEKVKGEFDLSTREGLLKGGEDGVDVKLYDGKGSRIYDLIMQTKDPHMPSKGPRLPDDAIAQIAAWIDNGAPYDNPLVAATAAGNSGRGGITEKDRQWWAFQPLKRPLPPQLAAGAQAASPIDAFLQAKLSEKSLALNPAADRRTLIRRASLDVLGLPPTPEEVEAFERDTDPKAWSKLVARLLNSPRYGERWARHWLDVARFAESSGFEHDYDRPNAYHYRDFVIKALNSDMPYDQFVRWQLAGDEYEPDNPLALMATGFLGAGVFPTQITANEVERTRYDAMDDMLSTTATAMLGLTVGCARCHDHKFDPIPTSDYYRMLSTFTTTVRSDIDLDMDPSAYPRAKQKFDREHIPLVAALKTYEARGLPEKFEAWLADGAPTTNQPTWGLLDVEAVKSKAGATFKKLEDGSYLVEGKNGDSDSYTVTALVKTPNLRSLRLEALADPSMPHGGPGRAENGNIGLSRIRVLASPATGGETNEIHLVRPRATFQQNGDNLSISSALDDDPHTGWAVDPQFGTNQAAIFDFEKPLSFEGSIRLTIKLEFDLNTRHNIGRPRLSVSTVADAGFNGDTLPENVTKALQTLRNRRGSGENLSETDRAVLLSWWKHSEPVWRSLDDKVQDHTRHEPKPKLTKVLVCAEGYAPVRMHTQGADFFNETYFLQRGSTDLKRGVATPGFLQVLLREGDREERWKWRPPSEAKFSGRRRSLANWITDEQTGAGRLLARVIVNRLWQHHFGQGLVATPNDFGAQGTKPSHPELLDWLASELISNGWRLKPIHQWIMESAAYQQTTAVNRAKAEADPANTMVSRQVPRRLEGEAIRDSLLFVSGELDTSMYGPGTLDPSSRRRSVYFTTKRSELIPVLQAFDAPEPLSSQGARSVTTVAPQALWIMNNPQVRSWAAAFAKRIAPGETTTLEAAVVRAYTLALNRQPDKSELSDAVDFIGRQIDRYKAAQKENARDLALTDFAHAVLSLNELIYVE